MSYTHDQKPWSSSEELFGEVISSYTDRQAVEDGVLVDFPGPGRINRVTRAVFDHFTEEMGVGMTNVGPLTQAMEHMLTVEIDNGWRTGDFRGKDLWLIPNEVGGFTLMFPEDY